jgi:hypothetical protein
MGRGNPSFGLAEAASKAEGPSGRRGSRPRLSANTYRGDRTVTVAAAKTAIAGSTPAASARFMRRARQTVSQRTANAPRGNTRLGSTPRLSARFHGRHVDIGWAAPGCNPGPGFLREVRKKVALGEPRLFLPLVCMPFVDCSMRRLAEVEAFSSLQPGAPIRPALVLAR